MEKRKQNRLTEYDYDTPGAYFITVCTDKRRNLFWKNVGAVIGRPFCHCEPRRCVAISGEKDR